MVTWQILPPSCDDGVRHRQSTVNTTLYTSSEIYINKENGAVRGPARPGQNISCDCGGMFRAPACCPCLGSLVFFPRQMTSNEPNMLIVFTDLPIIDSLILDTPREPLASGKASIKVPITVLLYSSPDHMTILHKRTEDLRVTRAGEEHQRPALMFCLTTRRGNYTMNVRLEDTSTEHRECITDIAYGMAGKRLCCVCIIPSKKQRNSL